MTTPLNIDGEQASALLRMLADAELNYDAVSAERDDLAGNLQSLSNAYNDQGAWNHRITDTMGSMQAKIDALNYQNVAYYGRIGRAVDAYRQAVSVVNEQAKERGQFLRFLFRLADVTHDAETPSTPTDLAIQSLAEDAGWLPKDHPEALKCDHCDGEGKDPYIQGSPDCERCYGRGTVSPRQMNGDNARHKANHAINYRLAEMERQLAVDKEEAIKIAKEAEREAAPGPGRGRASVDGHDIGAVEGISFNGKPDPSRYGYIAHETVEGALDYNRRNFGTPPDLRVKLEVDIVGNLSDAEAQAISNAAHDAAEQTIQEIADTRRAQDNADLARYMR